MQNRKRPLQWKFALRLDAVRRRDRGRPVNEHLWLRGKYWGLGKAPVALLGRE